MCQISRSVIYYSGMFIGAQGKERPNWNVPKANTESWRIIVQTAKARATLLSGIVQPGLDEVGVKILEELKSKTIVTAARATR